MKFGGSSVADPEKIKHVAQRLAAAKEGGREVVGTVSAMGKTTDGLLTLARQISPAPDLREMDMLLATGEQVTSALLAMALQALGARARSFTGPQVGLRTDHAHTQARISQIDGDRVRRALDAGEIAVVAGFQGLSDQDEITTLGRGGSDLTAVALAAALKADECLIYTDVDGVYTTDPRIAHKARRLEKISYEEMLEMASLGAKVLQTRSVELAMAQRVKVRVLSSFVEPGQPNNGTIVCDEEEIVEKQVVSGVAYSRDEAKVTLLGVEDHPGVAAEIFGRLADAHINVDMIVQSEARQAGRQNIVFTCPDRDAPRAAETIDAARAKIGVEDIHIKRDVAKVSVIGIGMRSQVGVARTMFAALAQKGINIEAIATSEIKISVLIDAQYTELAVRALHTAYGLDAV
jgi:aspartate kinase